MSALIPFNSAGGIPAHISSLFGDDDSNIAKHVSIDQLSYKGKVWRRVVGGEETVLTQIIDGESQPRTTVAIVVLDVNKARSRSYYPGSFVEGKNVAPTCYSADGVKPDAGVKEPCAATCAACPNSAKGSKITENGKQVAACSMFKRLAIVPSGKAISSHVPMLLRIAQTSIWDKENGENEANGWYAWDQYCDMLRQRGCKHTAQVETKVKFDTRMAYPKLLFKAERWLDPEESAAAKQRLTNDRESLDAILVGGASDGLAGTGETSVPDDAAEIAAAEKAAAEKAAAEKAAKAAAAKAAKEAKAKAEVSKPVEDDGFGSAPTKQSVAAASTPVAEPATVVTGTPSGLADLLDGWDA
ncbi:MAG TPA: hypothetical protein VI522_00385 [Gammaproteobacteria bacterium]|nr:hypothetical protein [Gammaproteobacteria bacterium]